MSKFKKLINFLKHPHGFCLVLIYLFAIVAIGLSIMCIFVDIGYFAYVIYALALISLFYIIYITIILGKKIKAKVIQMAKKHEFTDQILNDFGFRSLVFTGVSFVINLIYVIFEGTLSIVYVSIWYGALTLYYIILSITRATIMLRHKISKKHNDSYQYEKTRIKTYLNCGILLIILTISLSIAVVQMIYSNGSFSHPGWTIYAFAGYAFYKFIISIINLIKAKRRNDYILKSLKNLGFAEALVAILNLQASMFLAFGGDVDSRLFNMITGSTVIGLIIILSIYMIINASIALKRLDKAKNSD